jgi:hypothetical protein
MAKKILSVLAYLVSLLLLLSGLRWLLDPAGSAEGLGMPLLEGIGRSTQIGDLSAFFIVSGAFGLAGLVRRQPVLLYTPAAMVGGAALFRSLATLQGAPFATQLIVLEIVMTVILVAAARRMPG